MKKLLFVALLLLMLFGSAFAGKTNIYTLSNGMQVILKENHAMPLISSVVVVRAGSKYENDQNNGFTHLLEHMLFNGTEKRTRLELNEGIKDYGGYINAFTRQEMTGYLIVIPAEFIDEGLDLQSDQLFHSILPETEFPKERDIVAEEIKKDNDAIDNVASDYFNSVVFAGTPYARPVIGYDSTIRNVSRDEVMKYYKEHYVPNNMIALIIGDFETVQMLEKVNRYFGSIPRGELPKLAEFNINPPYGTEIHVKKYPTDVTYLQMTFPAPLFSDPDYYGFDIFSQILNSGESSPLNQALTSGNDPLAVEVSASLEIQKEYSLLNISIKTDKPDKIQAAIDTTVQFLKRFSSSNFTQADLNRIIVPSKVNEIKLEEKLHYYGIMKAPYLATCGYDFLENYIDNLSGVKPEMVSKAAKKYFSSPQYIACALEPDSTEVKK